MNPVLRHGVLGCGASFADKDVQKLSAGLIAKTEQMLGERAGHLELLKGKGKGGKKEGRVSEKREKKVKGRKGGMRGSGW